MAKFILAKKVSMTRTFRDDGVMQPVTILQAGPCSVTRLRDKDKDGYEAIQLGFVDKPKANKPNAGQTKALGKAFRYLKEFRTPPAGLEIGQTLDVSQFVVGEKVKITGWSKGRGFQGVVKRHHFHGHPASHGHKDQLRMPGSIGAGGVQHVRKGMRMAGRMGNQQVTVPDLEVIAIKPETNELWVKGAVPGARNGLILVSA